MSGEMQGMRVKTDERREDLVGRGRRGEGGCEIEERDGGESYKSDERQD